MNSQEFLAKLIDKKIKNGSIFNIKQGENFFGQIGVIRDTIVNLERKDLPVDMLTGDYFFEKVIEEGEE
jgi:hypothetical protein